jgi:glutaredoxin 3
LLDTYSLEPRPRVVEVDLRGEPQSKSLGVDTKIKTEDSDLIKLVLSRLTGRATFPNIIVKGKSIGGSDDIARLHGDGELAGMLQ